MSLRQFPCYLLPDVVQDHVVRFMDIYEKIQGSLVSPNFRAAVRRNRSILGHVFMEEKENFEKDGFGISDVFDRPPPTIQFWFPTWTMIERIYIRFCYLDHKDQVDRFLGGVTRVRLNEDRWMAVVGRNIVIFNSNPIFSKLADYQYILDLLSRTFVSILTFHLGNDVMPKEILFPLALRYRNSAETVLLIRSKSPNVCTDLTSTELSSLLDNLEAQKINFDWDAEPGTQYTGTLKTKDLTFGISPWLTIYHIMTMQCETFRAFTTSLTAVQINSFVRKWQDGGFAKLKWFYLTNISKTDDWLRAVDGIEGGPAEPYLTCFKKDIRGNDDKKAEIYFTPCTFQFYCKR